MINKHLINGMYFGGHELSLAVVDLSGSLSLSSGGTLALAPQALCQIS